MKNGIFCAWRKLRQSIRSARMVRRMEERRLAHVRNIICLALILFILDGALGRALAPISPGPQTPTGLSFTLDKVSMSTGNQPASPYTDYITTATPVDVIATSTKDPTNPIPQPFSNLTSNTTSAFGSGQVPYKTFLSLRIILEGMGSFSGVDPCTGQSVTAIPIELPDMQSTSNFGANKLVLQYQVKRQNSALPPDTIPINPFSIVGPTELRLVFPSSHGVICAANVLPLFTIGGITGGPNGLALDGALGYTLVATGDQQVTAYDSSLMNSAIRASISGNLTGLSNPFGIYVDDVNNEIGIANNGNNSVTVFDNDTRYWGNSYPKYVISGINTKLSGPGGIGEYLDSGGNTIIFVTNGTNDSVTFFDRSLLTPTVPPNPPMPTNVKPTYLIQGADTGLHAPCGLYLDTLNNEIGIANNGNDSITIYRLDDITNSIDGDVSPVRTIIGSDTGLHAPCGLYVDTVNDEIGVTNIGINTFTIYGRDVSGDAPPVRTIRGRNTGFDGPIGAYLDPSSDQIVVVNTTGDDVTAYPSRGSVYGAQLLRSPVLDNSAEQQALLAEYHNAYDGTASYTDPVSLVTNDDIRVPQQSAPDFNGYAFDWRLTSQSGEFRQVGDAVPQNMVPPNLTNFTLTNGNQQSLFYLQCPALTPFTILEYFTYSDCPNTAPLIVAPVPPPIGFYSIPAVILKTSYLENQVPYFSTPLSSSQFPVIDPMVTLSTNHDTIDEINWSYASEPPLIYSQSVQITLQQPIDTYPSCPYQQVAGNAATLVYASGTLTPDTRQLTSVTNPGSGCAINLSDVNAIVFAATDALGNSFNFSWTPAWTVP
jgi:hypothetical protein